MDLIDETNVSAGTYYKVIQVANLSNIVFQYKMVAGTSNTVEIQFWTSVYTDAEDSTDDDWVNCTEFLTEEEECSITKGTINDIAVTDSNVPFAKVKIKYIVTADTPDNSIKVGWNSNR